eukprot:1770968-Rhodomonas_salina.1
MRAELLWVDEELLQGELLPTLLLLEEVRRVYCPLSLSPPRKSPPRASSLPPSYARGLWSPDPVVGTGVLRGLSGDYYVRRAREWSFQG